MPINALARSIPRGFNWNLMQSRQNALNYITDLAQLRQLPEEVAWKREERGETRREWERRPARERRAEEAEKRVAEKHGWEKAERPGELYDKWLTRVTENVDNIDMSNWDVFADQAPPEYKVPRASEIKEAIENKYQQSLDPQMLNEVFRSEFLPGYIKRSSMMTEYGLKTQRIKAEKEGKEQTPLSDIGKLKFDRERLINSGVRPDDPVIKAIDDEIARKGKPEQKPTNMPAWYDSMGVEKLGSRYHTPEGMREFADWVSNPKNQTAVSTYRQKYAEEGTPKTFTVYPGGTGPLPFQSRGPGAGALPSGQGAKMPAEVLTRLSDTKNVIGTMDILEGMALDPKMSKRFGPIDGRFTKIKQMFIEDGPTQEMMNNIESLIRVAYSLSGKQISYQEMELLKSAMLPQLNQPHLNFMATLKTARRWMESSYNDLLNTYTQSGYSSNLQPIQPKSVGKDVQERKTIGSKSFIKINGKWYEE